MSKENLNNIPNWKAKLDALDNLPGDTAFDKNDAWEKLHARLGGKTESKKSMWYWVAAACIFFALMIPLFYSIRTNQHVAIYTVKENQPSTKALSGKIIDEETAAAVTNSSLANNDRKAEETSSKSQKQMIYENKKIKLRLTYAVSPEALSPETLSNFTKPVDTAASLATIQQEKKKLKVVHINELGDPVETLPEIVKNSDRHTFQFKIASQETYINPATASNTNGFTILKIKTSQN